MPGTAFATERESVAVGEKDDTDLAGDETPADGKAEAGKEQPSEVPQPTDVQERRGTVRNAVTKTIYTPDGPREVHKYPYPFGHGVQVSENTD